MKRIALLACLFIAGCSEAPKLKQGQAVKIRQSGVQGVVVSDRVWGTKKWRVRYFDRAGAGYVQEFETWELETQ